jgi:TonB family protein
MPFFARYAFVAMFMAGMFLSCSVLSAQEIVQPRVLERVAPEYTPEALESGLEGRVVLETIIRMDGTPEVTRPTRGMRMGLNEKAIEAVEKWTFAPGTIGGVPAEMRLNIEVRFSLSEEEEEEQAPEVEP